MSRSEHQRPSGPTGEPTFSVFPHYFRAKFTDWKYGISTSLGLTDERDKRIVFLTIARSNLRSLIINHRHSSKLDSYAKAESGINSILQYEQRFYSGDAANRPHQIQNAVNTMLLNGEQAMREGSVGMRDMRRKYKEWADAWLEQHGPLVPPQEDTTNS